MFTPTMFSRGRILRHYEVIILTIIIILLLQLLQLLLLLLLQLQLLLLLLLLTITIMITITLIIMIIIKLEAAERDRGGCAPGRARRSRAEKLWISLNNILMLGRKATDRLEKLESRNLSSNRKARRDRSLPCLGRGTR